MPLPDGIREAEWPPGAPRGGSPHDFLRMVPDFEALLEEVRPDLVHAGPIQSCAFLAALAGFHPLLAMSWGSDILVDADRDGIWRWMTRYTLLRADLLLCDCNAVRSKVHGLVPYPDEQIVQFPWGVDLDRVAPGPEFLRLRYREGWEDAFVVLSTRSWESIYGIETLLEAFRRAHDEDPRLRLVLLGSGSLAPQVRDFIAAHGLRNVVTEPGEVPHERVSEYFRAADAYVSCALSDGTSVSLLEALATGLPVVVTDNPGNREWVVPERNGWLAPAADTQAFARLLREAARLPSPDRERIAEENRRVAESRADWKTNSNLLLDAYERLGKRAR